MMFLTRDIIPCWHELFWDEKSAGIGLRIHKDYIAQADFEITEETPIVASLMKTFSFSDFCGDFRKNIGFSSLLKRKGEKEGFFEYLARLPVGRKATGNPCRQCGGSGIDELTDLKCLSCRGLKKEYSFDWKSVNEVSATFTVFLSFLSLFDEEKISASFPQLVTVDMAMIDRMLSGHPIGGEFGVPLTSWLRTFDARTSFPEVTSAMIRAYGRMAGRLHNYEKREFRAYVDGDKAGFVSVCPGNACGIHPEDWHMREGEGYRFACHNVDSALQQLSLLAGLAALHDKARREM